MNNFEKEAQRRSIPKAVGRAINPIEWMRQLSSQKYRRLIAEVDRIDDQMRKRVSYLKPSLRDQLHKARMAMKNHEYRTVFQYATAILNSVDGVFIDKMGELDELGRRIYQDFAKDKMSPEDVKQLEEDLFRESATGKSADIYRELVVEAGITQWLQEKMPTRRELEGNLFNSLFQNIKGKQQEAAREALIIAERTYDLIKEAFARLDGERRNIMEYVKLSREYHKNLSREKDRLKRLYLNYFLANEPEAQTQTAPPVALPAALPAAPPVSPAPPVPVAPPAAPVQTPPATTNPATIDMSGVNQDDPNKKSAVDRLLNRAKLAAFNGDVGIVIALLSKASELCDEIGDEPRSVGLLKAAENLDRIRGRTKDVCYFDEAQSFTQDNIRVSKDQIMKAMNAGFGSHVLISTPKYIRDGKEIK